VTNHTTTYPMVIHKRCEGRASTTRHTYVQCEKDEGHDGPCRAHFGRFVKEWRHGA